MMTQEETSGALPPVPSHWHIRPLWTVADRRQETGFGDAELLSVYLHHGVIPQSEGDLGVHAASVDRSAYQRVLPGDFVLNNQQAFRGSVGVSDLEGIVSPAYIVLKLHPEVLDCRYASHLLASRPMVGQYEQASRGVGTIQRQLHRDALRAVQVPVPPLEEQRAIADYLDREVARLDALVQKKRRLARALQDRRRALIRTCTRRGVAEGRLRDSGLPYVGRIPAHWSLVPNRAVLSLKQETVRDRHRDYTLLSLTTRGVVPRDISDNSGKFPASFDSYQRVGPGDVVFCLFDVPETPRTVGLVTVEGMVTGAYTVCATSEDRANPAYIAFLFEGFDDEKSLSLFYSGLRNVIRRDTFLGIKIPLPPRDEQDQIVGHLQSEMRRVDGALRRLDQQLDLLGEHRQALITAAVTGELEVPGVAA